MGTPQVTPQEPVVQFEEEPVDLVIEYEDEQQQQENEGFMRKATRFLEDLGYPGLGASIGAKLGAPLGPYGVAGGAALGAAGGEAVKLLKRDVTGEEAPQGMDRMGDIAEAGAFGSLQEVGAARKAAGVGKKALTPAQELAKEFGVPMSKATQYQTAASSSFESIIRRSLGTEGIFRKRLDEPANRALVKAANEIGEEISRVSTTRRGLGKTVDIMLQASDRAAGKIYDDALNQIAKAGAKDVPLNVTGDLMKTARDLLSTLRLPPHYEKGLEKIESREAALEILKSFANPFDKKGNVIPLTFEQARRLRTQLYTLTHTGESTIGKGSLQQLNKALNDAMKESLVQAGRRDLAQTFETASGNYKRVQDLLDYSTIRALIRNDKPEEVGRILLSKGAGTTAENLRKLIGPKSMLRVERGLWEEIFNSVLEKNEGVVVGGKIEKAFQSLGPETQRAIWGNRPEMLAKIRRFIKTADTVSLKSSLAKPTSAQTQSLLAFGQFQAIQAGVTAGVLGFVGGTSDTPGQFFIRGGGTLAASFLGPRLIARLLTRPDAINVMEEALRTPSTSRRGAELSYKLMMMVMSEQERDRFENRSKKMMADQEQSKVKESGSSSIQ